MDSALRKRVITAAVLLGSAVAVGVLGVVVPGGQWIYAVVTTLIVGICAIEFGQVCGTASGMNPVRVAYPLLASLPALIVLLLAGGDKAYSQTDSQLCWLLSAAIVGGIAAVGWAVFSGAYALHRAERAARDLGIGMFHIGVCGACVTVLSLTDGAVWGLLWLVVVVCCNDSAAYFVGRAVGGPKLAPAISPNKTISGSIAGVLGGVTAGLISSVCLRNDESLSAVAVLSVAVVVAAQLGDLAKSYVKRLHGVKDSGSFLPGHGGFLDRMDGMLMGAPIVYLWLIWVSD